MTSGLLLCAALVVGTLAPQPATTPAGPGGPAAATPIPTAKFVLHNNGKEPRQQLVLRPHAGAKSNVNVITRDAFTGGGSYPVKLKITGPAVCVNATAVVDAVSPEGDIDFRVVFGKSLAVDGLEPGMGAVFNQALAKLEGVEVASSVSNRGIARKATEPLPEENHPLAGESIATLRQLLLQHGQALLPEDPIGVGAEWSVESPTEIYGVSTGQVATYTLQQVLGDYGCILDVSVVILPATGQVEDAPFRPGVKCTTQILGGEGKGRIGVSFLQLLPISVEMKRTVRSSTTLHGPGPDSGLETKDSAELEIVVRPGTGCEAQEAPPRKLP